MTREIVSRCPATPWPRRAALCCVAVLLAALPACTASRGGGESTVAAEADLYSGLPNPVWRLAPGAARELGSMLRALQPGGVPAEAPGLGYRGLVVRGVEEVLPGCSELRAYRGTVAAQCGAATRSLADPGRAVERFLAGTGLRAANPGAYAAVRQELDAGG
jgi:hypothetical protein